MPEEITGTTGQTAGEAGSSTPTTPAATGTEQGTAAPSAGGQTAGQQQAGKTFSQADLDRIVQTRLSEEKDRAKRASDDAAAKAKGEWETVAKANEARVRELEADIERQKLDILRRDVAARHSLAPKLAARLQGATEAELEADAKDLASLAKPLTAGTVDGGAGKSATPKSSMNDLIRGTR